jgi:hypothetical protein
VSPDDQKALLKTPFVTLDLAGRYTTIILMFTMLVAGLGALVYLGFQKLEARIDKTTVTQTELFNRLVSEQQFTTCVLWAGKADNEMLDERLLRQKCGWLRKETWPRGGPGE